MTTVLVVDDQALIRQAVTEILNNHDDIVVVGEASNGSEAVRLTSRLHPEVVVTHRLPLEEAAHAYDLADRGEGGKVCITFD